MKLQSPNSHPHGLSDREYNRIFTKDKPIIFAFHGYPTLIHELTYKRENLNNLHVHGYKEEGTITTPFDMRVQNELDRYHLVMNVLRNVKCKNKMQLLFHCEEMLGKHRKYIREYGVDMPEVDNFKWE